MSRPLQDLLADSAAKIVGALARVLLRNGVACGTLEQIVRKAYVDEARRLAAETNSKGTVSSISAQTGLSRKEVKRLLEPEQPPLARSKKYNRAVRVISGWLHDPAYASEEGVALPLPLQGEGPGSFAQLVKDYSGDVTPKAMLDLLVASNCMKVASGLAYLVRHAYVPTNDSKEIIRILGVDSAELIRTIDHNLTCAEDATRFQRKVSTSLLPTRVAQQFRELVRSRSQALLEEYVIWLNEHEANEGEERRYVSIGLYLYEDEIQPESSP